MAERASREHQWDFYARQTDVAKKRAMDRLTLINQIEALMEAGMTKSAAVRSRHGYREHGAAPGGSDNRVAIQINLPAAQPSMDDYMKTIEVKVP